MLLWKWDLLEAGCHSARKCFGLRPLKDLPYRLLPKFSFALSAWTLLCSWCPPKSCCLAGVACEGVTLRSQLMLRMWLQPSFDIVIFCFLFIIPSRFCICTPVFMACCWHLKKSGLNDQKDLSGAALLTSPCKHRARGQTSVFSEHPSEACAFGVLGQMS